MKGDEDMNPFCPKCKVAMTLKNLVTYPRVSAAGRAKHWVCSKCKRKFRAGGQIIA